MTKRIGQGQQRTRASDKPQAVVVATSIESNAYPRYDIEGFAGWVRAEGPVPYTVKLELRANAAFVDRLQAFLHGEGVDIPGAPETRSERGLTQGRPLLPPGPIEGVFEPDDARERNHPGQTSRTLDDPDSEAPFYASFDDDDFDPEGEP